MENEIRSLNTVAHEALSRLVSRYGEGLARDPRRVEALLRDECADAMPDIKPQIKLLRAASEERIVQGLYASRTVSLDLRIPELVQVFMRQQTMDRGSAQWAIESWAAALNLLKREVSLPRSRETDVFRIDPASRAKGSTGGTGTNPGGRTGASTRGNGAGPGGGSAGNAGGAGDNQGAKREIPLPGPSLVERLIAVFRTADGKPRWVPIALAVAGALLVVSQLGSQLGSPSGPRIRTIQFGGTTFTGERDQIGKIVGSGETLERVINFEVPAGFVVRKILRRDYVNERPGTEAKQMAIFDLSEGDLRTRRYVEKDIRIRGVGLSVQYDYQLLCADDKPCSAIFPFRYETTALPGTSGPRVKGIDFPKQIRADRNKNAFRIQFEDADGDIEKLEIESHKGNFRGGAYPLSGVAGQKEGSFTYEFWTDTPQVFQWSFRLVDKAGNVSRPHFVEFESIPAPAGQPAPGPGSSAGPSAPSGGPATPPALVPPRDPGPAFTLNAPRLVGARAPAQVFPGKGLGVTVNYTGGPITEVAWRERGNRVAAGRTRIAVRTGTDSGSAFVNIPIPGSVFGTVQFDVWVIDASGRQSNVMLVSTQSNPAAIFRDLPNPFGTSGRK